jgi:hypothetical protein
VKSVLQDWHCFETMQKLDIPPPQLQGSQLQGKVANGTIIQHMEQIKSSLQLHKKALTQKVQMV